MPVPGPGRPKGCKNKYTQLKEQILIAVQNAAKVAGFKSSEEYLATMCAKDGMNFLRIAAGLLPKDTNINVGGQPDNPVAFAPVQIVMPVGDDDKGKEK